VRRGGQVDATRHRAWYEPGVVALFRVDVVPLGTRGRKQPPSDWRKRRKVHKACGISTPPGAFFPHRVASVGLFIWFPHKSALDAAHIRAVASGPGPLDATHRPPPPKSALSHPLFYLGATRTATMLAAGGVTEWPLQSTFWLSAPSLLSPPLETPCRFNTSYLLSSKGSGADRAEGKWVGNRHA
jgi:hypothetical protein